MTSRSPVMATALVMFFLVAVPVGLIRRVSNDVWPLQPFDIPLAIGLIAWLLVAKSIIDRNETVDSVVHYRLSPRWQAHSLVEQSFFGVGFTSSRSVEPFAVNQLGLVSLPTDLVASQLPPAIYTPSDAWADPHVDSETDFQAIPTLRDDPAPLGFLATETYEVQRRDTLWSLTAQVLGDGRQWKSIEALNVGREVAPGLTYEQGDALRIGWSILIPLVASDSEEASK